MTQCAALYRAGYQMAERGLLPDDVIAKVPGPTKSPTSYRAFLKTAYIQARPDWVMEVILKADRVRLPCCQCSRLRHRNGQRVYLELGLQLKPFDSRSGKEELLG